MKKTLIFVLCGIMLFGVTACGNEEQTKIKNDNKSETKNVSYEIGQAIYFNPETTTSCKELDVEYNMDNLSQSCARFKELVTQFNSGFGQLPGKE